MLMICTKKLAVADASNNMKITDICSECNKATVRPDIVWFGEIPYYMDDIETHLNNADMFVSIGTSGNVYPAAGFVNIARKRKIDTVELNLEPTGNPYNFTYRMYGPATVVVPQWVERVLQTSN